MSGPVAQLEQAAAVIRSRWKGRPRVGLILGTGLGNLASHIRPDEVLPYAEIPHFPCATALGHRGQLVCGHIGPVPVIAMDGRCHIYEGYPLNALTLPVRTMRAVGIELLILSNASGGMNPRYRSGDVMIVQDHINLLWSGALAGPLPMAAGRNGRPRPSPYDPALVGRALELARCHNFVAHPGVYVAVTGPNFETRAEYRFLRRIGGDAVGMSTVPEVMTAAQCGMRVLALSAITNVARPDSPQVVHATDVVALAQRAEPNIRSIVLETVAAEANRHT